MNNWRRYLDSLAPQRQTSAAQNWDCCILTASDETQAAMMRRQLERRRRRGLLPDGTRFFVVADPNGKRVGSGGATLRLLSAMYHAAAATSMAPFPPDLHALTEYSEPHHRALIIHSGGDSRRLPHCSAVGKLFAPIPHLLPDGRASTIFDEMLINLSGVGGNAPAGALVLSGDVLLVFDHLQLSFQRRGVTGVAVAAPLWLGQRHGVYVQASGQQRVDAFLHKATAKELAHWGAIDEKENVQIDTGLVWFDAATAADVAALAGEPGIRTLIGSEAPVSGINLYGDLLRPLAKSTEYQAYLEDESDGPATPELRAARKVIWSQLKGTYFGVERLDPAVFVHFGTSAEYWRMVTSDETLRQLCGWSQHTASWLDDSPETSAQNLTLINAVVGGRGSEDVHNDEPGSPALVTDCAVGDLSWRGQAIVSGLITDGSVNLGHDTILHQLPVQGGYVTRVFGIRDDPKHPWNTERATFGNRPFTEWFAAIGLKPDVLWPHVASTQRNLWHARLFAVCADRDDSLEMALPLQNPEQAPDGWRERWLAARRISLAEGFAQADGGRILNDIVTVENRVAAHIAADAIREERPTAEIAVALHTEEGTELERRCALLQALLNAQGDFVNWRVLSVLAHATGNSQYEDSAFSSLASVIEQDVARHQRELSRAPFMPGMSKNKASTRVEAAARIDFGGGWTDTPPYSLERDSYVLNAAVALRGRMPIAVEAAWIDDARVILESRDIGEAVYPSHAGEIIAYRNPADPFSLTKAALVMVGIVPAGTPPETEISEVLRGLPGGIRLSTQTFIPRGSGLGTSSIMAGAVLACLNDLAGTRLEPDQLFDQVLSIEQMMTTGGGWQDQVGGLVGGVKMVSSEPGLPQNLRVEMLQADITEELNQRTFLVYTGQQRLAKNLLRSIMAQWIARDEAMVDTLQSLGALAREMEKALRARKYAEFGALVADHWEFNRRMDPGCTNPFIDELFAVLEPFSDGAKLAGAGGGGFAIVIARSDVDFHMLDAEIRRRYAGAPVSVWPCHFPNVGLVYV